ncbi:MAG TPA: carbohydrate ABC transporter permease, partial [Metabacillus sp.]|nr:carbohydrate ABC transporter permease [Metabacillus sp.]
MRNKKRTILLIILASFIALLFLIPIFWMFSTSFKNDFEAIAGGLRWFPKDPTIENYTYTLFGEGIDVRVLRWMFNSIFVGLLGA